MPLFVSRFLATDGEDRLLLWSRTESSASKVFPEFEFFLQRKNVGPIFIDLYLSMNSLSLC